MTHTLVQQPAEWERHSACWLAWPSHGHLWQENLAPAQAEFAALCLAIAEQGGEALELLVQDEDAEAQARAALGPVLDQVRFHWGPPASASMAGAGSTSCPAMTRLPAVWLP